jgi:putative DNA primase/helicase
LGLCAPKELGNLIFGMAGGSGKARLRADASEKPTSHWRTFFTLSGERGLAQMMQIAEQPMLTGHAVRVPDINISDMKKVSRELYARIAKCKTNFGHAGSDFVVRLFKDGFVTDPDALFAKVMDTVDIIAGPGAEAPMRRAAVPFAVMGVAGDVAKAAGVIPVKADLQGAIEWAWTSYLSSSEAEPLNPMARAIDRMRETLQRDWDVEIFELAALQVANDNHRAVKWGWYDDDTIYILRERLSDLAGKADKPQAIAKALRDFGFLQTCGDKLHHTYLKGRGALPHYRLNLRGFLGLDEPDAG